MNPKLLFQQTVRDADKFSSIVLQPSFQTAMVFAQSYALSYYHLTSEEMAGIRIFCQVLSELGEPEKKQPIYPDKRLQYDLTPEPKEKTRKK